MSWWDPDGDEGRGWRGAFTRPATLLLAALLTAGGVVAIVVWSGSQLAGDLRMGHATICPAVTTVHAGGTACLSVVPLQKERGRIGHKTLTHVWTVTPANGGDSQIVDVSFLGSRRLRHEKSLGPVTGLSWHGDLVAFRGVDGTEVDTDQFGAIGLVGPLAWAMFLAGVCLGALASLIGRRRAGRSWWSAEPSTTGSTWLVGASWGLIAVSIVLQVPQQIGAPVWVDGAIVVIGALAVVTVLARVARLDRQAPPPQHLASSH